MYIYITEFGLQAKPSNSYRTIVFLAAATDHNNNYYYLQSFKYNFCYRQIHYYSFFAAMDPRMWTSAINPLMWASLEIIVANMLKNHSCQHFGKSNCLQLPNVQLLTITKKHLIFCKLIMANMFRQIIIANILKRKIVDDRFGNYNC